MQSIFVNNKSISLQVDQPNYLEKWTENHSVVGIVVIKSPYSRILYKNQI